MALTLWSCPGLDLQSSTREKKKWIFRILPSYQKLATIIGSALAHFRWSRVMLVTIKEERWWKIAKEVEFNLNQLNFGYVCNNNPDPEIIALNSESPIFQTQSGILIPNPDPEYRIFQTQS